MLILMTVKDGKRITVFSVPIFQMIKIYVSYLLYMYVYMPHHLSDLSTHLHHLLTEVGSTYWPLHIQKDSRITRLFIMWVGSIKLF